MREPKPPTSPLAAQLGGILTAARTKRGLSRRALAKELGVSDVSLLGYEHGTKNPTLTKVVEVAEQYGLVVELRVSKKPG